MSCLYLFLSNTFAQTPSPAPSAYNVYMKSDGYWWQKSLCLSDTSDGYQKLLPGSCKSHNFNQFGMISLADGNWCMYVPDDIAQNKADWSYIQYKPCQIGDPQQSWTTYYDPDYRARRFKPANYPNYKYYANKNGYAFLSKKGGEAYVAVLDYSKQETATFLNSPSAPKKLGLDAAFYWESKNVSYPIFPNGATYFEDNNYLINDKGQCGRSNLEAATTGWAYITFETCPPNPKTASNQFKWIINSSRDGLNFDNITVYDFNGNKLVNSVTGSKWGVPYVASPDYIMKNRGQSWYNDYYSIFDIEADAYRALAQNEFKSGSQCSLKNDTYYPATKGITVRSPTGYNPPDIRDSVWANLLWKIATSSNLQSERLGGWCGLCVLQSFEMIDQILTASHFGLTRPPSSSGLLFDIGAPDPLASFRNNHARRADQLTDNMERVNQYMETQQPPRVTAGQFALYDMSIQQYAIANLMPTYQFTSGSYRYPILNNMVADIRSSPVGTAYIAFVRVAIGGQWYGHTVPIYNNSHGPTMITTNADATRYPLEAFTMEIGRTFVNGNEFTQRLRESMGDNSVNVVYVNLLRAGERPPQLGFSQQVSFNGCTGAGPGSRGNGATGFGSTTNMCSPGGGRCQIQ